MTYDGKYGTTNGKSVSRNEFGISGGIFWSPENNYIAFYREDLSNITDYPIVNTDETPAKLENIKYPMAGQSSSNVDIGIYNIKEDQIIWLQIEGPKDQYLTSVTWGPEEQYIYVAHLNRDQNHLKLKQYYVSDGKQNQILFEEKNEKYVEPESPLFFLPNSNNKFLWFSERDGWNHLYLYNTNGDLIRQITRGEWLVTKIHGFDTAGNYVYITTTKENPLERHFYSVELKTDKIKKLTRDSGTHSIRKNQFNMYFIDTFSNLNLPREIRIINNKGDVLSIIHKSDNPLKEYRLGDIKLLKLKSKNDQELHCRMIYPLDFDSTKIYPVIVYVYGGPHVQLVRNTWGYGKYALWFQKMAQEGFIVFTLDNRGSDNRGLDFEQATFRKLGTIEIEDQLTGVEYLKSLPYVNGSRIGVFGWSYGGFMTTSLMLRTNGTFKVGVGGGAVIDWKYYEVMYTERYMDTPQDNPEGYYESSLLNYIENLDGKLLLVHGTSDSVVVWQHSLAFAKKAANFNKHLDYYPYIGHGHGVKEKDALHLYTKITDYFIDNL
ncbi:DPP IV N-terminal domain-containing protein [Bacteroidota bacterium]